eukprot:TRINITY_DN7608_c0_g1_i9.p1 TRINITY_DN7608_c0_g1~~TRINITY_DN7608_c0_g1_i9.p1  ORF type:complete len:1173 (+),score=226.30 TRINITY_DN7608_c0_g1_i9:125-3643(+)
MMEEMSTGAVFSNNVSGTANALVKLGAFAYKNWGCNAFRNTYKAGKIVSRCKFKRLREEYDIVCQKTYIEKEKMETQFKNMFDKKAVFIVSGHQMIGKSETLLHVLDDRTNVFFIDVAPNTNRIKAFPALFAGKKVNSRFIQINSHNYDMKECVERSVEVVRIMDKRYKEAAENKHRLDSCRTLKMVGLFGKVCRKANKINEYVNKRRNKIDKELKKNAPKTGKVQKNMEDSLECANAIFEGTKGILEGSKALTGIDIGVDDCAIMDHGKSLCKLIDDVCANVDKVFGYGKAIAYDEEKKKRDKVIQRKIKKVEETACGCCYWCPTKCSWWCFCKGCKEACSWWDRFCCLHWRSNVEVKKVRNIARSVKNLSRKMKKLGKRLEEQMNKINFPVVVIEHASLYLNPSDLLTMAHRFKDFATVIIMVSDGKLEEFAKTSHFGSRTCFAYMTPNAVFKNTEALDFVNPLCTDLSSEQREKVAEIAINNFDAVGIDLKRLGTTVSRNPDLSTEETLKTFLKVLKTQWFSWEHGGGESRKELMDFFSQKIFKVTDLMNNNEIIPKDNFNEELPYVVDTKGNKIKHEHITVVVNRGLEIELNEDHNRKDVLAMITEKDSLVHVAQKNGQSVTSLTHIYISKIHCQAVAELSQETLRKIHNLDEIRVFSVSNLVEMEQEIIKADKEIEKLTEVDNIGVVNFEDEDDDEDDDDNQDSGNSDRFENKDDIIQQEESEVKQNEEKLKRLQKMAKLSETKRKRKCKQGTKPEPDREVEPEQETENVEVKEKIKSKPTTKREYRSAFKGFIKLQLLNEQKQMIARRQYMNDILGVKKSLKGGIPKEISYQLEVIKSQSELSLQRVKKMKSKRTPDYDICLPLRDNLEIIEHKPRQGEIWTGKIEDLVFKVKEDGEEAWKEQLYGDFDSKSPSLLDYIKKANLEVPPLQKVSFDHNPTGEEICIDGKYRCLPNDNKVSCFGISALHSMATDYRFTGLMDCITNSRIFKHDDKECKVWNCTRCQLISVHRFVSTEDNITKKDNCNISQLWKHYQPCSTVANGHHDASEFLINFLNGISWEINSEFPHAYDLVIKSSCTCASPLNPSNVLMLSPEQTQSGLIEKKDVKPIEKKDSKPIEKKDVKPIEKDSEPIEKKPVDKKDIKPIEKKPIEKKDSKPIEKKDSKPN